MTASEAVAIARRYVEAWNAHDAAGIVASFAPAGTYQDPVTQQPIGGAALQGFTQACLDARSTRWSRCGATRRWPQRGASRAAPAGSC